MPATTIRFNKRTLDELPPAPSGKRVYYRDPNYAHLRLTLSVTSAGVKSWLVQRRVNGRPKNLTLGRYPDLTPQNAEKKAAQVATEMALGKDPSDEARQKRATTLTLRQALEDMLSTRQLKTATASQYRNVMNSQLGDWMDQPIKAITRDMVAARHLAITKNGGKLKEGRRDAYANLTMRTLRAVWNHAAGLYEDHQGESLLPANPVQRLSKTRAWNRSVRRKTYIQEHQLPEWHAAVEELRTEPDGSMGQTVGDLLILLLLTGLRRSEGMNLTWDNVDLKAQWLRVPDTKNHEDHVLPLSSDLVALLHRRQAMNSDSKWVFPSPTDSTQPIREPRYQVQQVIDRSGVAFTLHDLRRTFITAAEGLDLSHYALKRLVNHKMTGDVTAGYISSNMERLRQPVQRISDHLLACCTGSTTGQISE